MKALAFLLLAASPAAAALAPIELPRAAPTGFMGTLATVVAPALALMSAAPLSGPAPLPAAVTLRAALPAPIPGTPFLRIGTLRLDSRAPGAHQVVQAMEIGDAQARERAVAKGFDGSAPTVSAWPILGIFRLRDAQVVNGYTMGVDGIHGHSDAIPPGLNRREHGGYVLFVRPEGQVAFRDSGTLPAAITPAVRRSILRYYGLRAERETRGQRLKRWALRAWDAVAGLF